MGTSERRMALLKTLCRRRYDTVCNLANEFGVSERTIRRDIEALSYDEPIYTQTGRHVGGVYVVDKYDFNRTYFNEKQLAVLQRLFAVVNEDYEILSSAEIAILQQLINEYTKPTAPRTNRREPE